MVAKVTDIVASLDRPRTRSCSLSMRSPRTPALDHAAPTLATPIAIPEHQTHDYVRHGTATLFIVPYRDRRDHRAMQPTSSSPGIPGHAQAGVMAAIAEQGDKRHREAGGSDRQTVHIPVCIKLISSCSVLKFGTRADGLRC